ncbi:MAG: hypothetical protein RLN99_02445 [Kiloniellaceae bacterium]
MRRRGKATTWASVAADAWMLGIDASTVVGLRTLKLAAGGPAAKAESRRMLSEKAAAAQAWQWLAFTGGLGTSAPTAASKTLRHYSRKVKANRRRLEKG